MSNEKAEKTRTKISVCKDIKIGELEKNVFGSFLEHVGRAIYSGIYEPDHPGADEDGFRTDVINYTRELNVPIVRYPGGNFVSGYRWQDGIGDKSKRPSRPELAWRVIETNQVGIDEFSKWAKKVGCDVLPTINMGTGTPRDAVEFLEYCNFREGTYWSDLRKKNGYNEPFGYKYWCIGNEMDGPWQICHMNAAEYGEKANETIKMMKWLDPSIKVTVAGSSSPELSTFPEWDRTVLEKTYENTDFLSLHKYYGFNSEKDNLNDFLHCYLDFDGFIKSIIATSDYVKALKRSKKNMMLSIDEWNIWHQHIADPASTSWECVVPKLENSYSVADALAFSGMMMTMINHADRVKIGCLAQLVNVIAPILTKQGGAAIKQTIYYPYSMACRFAKGNALACMVDGTKVETGYGEASALYASSTFDEESGELTMFLLNSNSDDAIALIELDKFGKLMQTEHLMLGNGNLELKNTFENPNVVTMKTISSEKPYIYGEEILIPGYSFNVIRYKANK